MTIDDCSGVILVIGFVSCSSFVVFVFVFREGGKLLFSFCYTNADLPIALHWAGITVTCFELKLQANGLSKNSYPQIYNRKKETELMAADDFLRGGVA